MKLRELVNLLKIPTVISYNALGNTDVGDAYIKFELFILENGTSRITEVTEYGLSDKQLEYEVLKISELDTRMGLVTNYRKSRILKLKVLVMSL